MINITDAEFLSISTNFEFLGEAFNYRNLRTLDLRGRVSVVADSGVSLIWGGMSTKISGLQDNQEIFVNGISLGSGNVKSIQFDDGVDVREKKYSLSVEIPMVGNLYNMTGAAYSGLILDESSLKYIDSLTEDFNFSAIDNNSYSYSRNLSFGVLSGNPLPVQAAKDLASAMFSGSPVVRLLNINYPNFYESNGNKYYTESYDLENHRFSFSEEFSFNPDYPYFFEYSHSLNFSQGLVEITENGTINGASGVAYDSALIGLSSITGSSYSRVTGIYDAYVSRYALGNVCPIINKPKSISFSANQCVGAITYGISYTNDSSFYQSGYIWNKTMSIDESSVGIYSISERGNVVGLGQSAFKIAKSGYNSVVSNVGSRITGAFSSINPILINDCLPTGQFSLVRSGVDFSEYNADFSYEINYTNDPYLTIGDDKFVRVFVSSGYFSPIHTTAGFQIFNSKDIIQPGNSSTLSSFEYKINIVGKESTLLIDYINEALSRISPPSNSGVFLQSVNYSHSPTKNDFNLSATFSFPDFRNFGDTLIW